MLIEPFVDEGLGNSSYLIASEAAGLAAVVDPQRDVDRYLQRAEALGLRLRLALDTHLHNDFVSGVRELAALAGVQVGASALAELGFEHQPLREGDALPLGDLSLGVLATPGHTPEHLSFTVTQAAPGAPSAVFTGGALMVGGAARTDLLGPEWTTRLARQLYHSLHGKLLKLPDTTVVYPGTVLLEGTNISEGRGTTRPFELVGAPWADPERVAADLNARELPGVHFRPALFEPTFHKHAKVSCGGCQIHVTDRRTFRSVT